MTKAPETAFILAAGLGTRMRPLTNDRPKALIEVAGKTLLDHMLDRLKAAGTQRFVVNVHYFADKLQAHLALRQDLDIIISDEREALLETGGGLKKARPLLGDAPIFVVNTDSLWSEDPGEDAIAGLVDLWNPEVMEVALLLADMNRSTGFEGAGDVFLEAGQALRFRGDATSAPYAYMGVHITKPQIVENIADTAFSPCRRSGASWRPRDASLGAS